MSIAYWCVLFIIIFPYIMTVAAKWGKHYDNHKPREYLDATTGWRKRAHYVQLNTFEALPAFGLAVVIAHLGHVYQPTLDKIAIIFVLARIMYAICYLTNKALFRTLFWLVGFGCVIGMFYLTYQAS